MMNKEIPYYMFDEKGNSQVMLSNGEAYIDDEDLKDVLDYYQELLRELSFYLARETFSCFSKILEKPATLKDTVEFIMSKYDKLEIYDLPQEVNKKTR